MKVAFYHPNMHLFGGGEAVCLTLASELRKEHDVTIFISQDVSVKALEEFFSLPLDGVSFKVCSKWLHSLPWLRSYRQSLHLRFCMREFKGFDAVIDTCSNGLFYKKIPAKTFCYVHFPNFTSPKKGVKSLLNFLLIKKEQMYSYDVVLCNSEFTQNHVAMLTEKETSVVYPPVTVEACAPAPKKDVIMSIGRFSPEKKFDVMIDSFIACEEELPGYTLHLVGVEGEKAYLQKLQDAAQGHRIVFHLNVPHEQVLVLLSSARFYWHARGYGESDPVEYENFGITTVEAIASECFPFVVELGAQPEIVAKTGVGVCWKEPQELSALTVKYARSTFSVPTYRSKPLDLSMFSSKKFLDEWRVLLQEGEQK